MECKRHAAFKKLRFVLAHSKDYPTWYYKSIGHTKYFQCNGYWNHLSKQINIPAIRMK